MENNLSDNSKKNDQDLNPLIIDPTQNNQVNAKLLRPGDIKDKLSNPPSDFEEEFERRKQDSIQTIQNGEVEQNADIVNITNIQYDSSNRVSANSTSKLETIDTQVFYQCNKQYMDNKAANPCDEQNLLDDQNNNQLQEEKEEENEPDVQENNQQ